MVQKKINATTAIAMDAAVTWVQPPWSPCIILRRDSDLWRAKGSVHRPAASASTASRKATADMRCHPVCTSWVKAARLNLEASLLLVSAPCRNAFFFSSGNHSIEVLLGVKGEALVDCDGWEAAGVGALATLVRQIQLAFSWHLVP
jgi:hypothetical protein